MFEFISRFFGVSEENQEQKKAAQALLDKYEEDLEAFHEAIAPDEVDLLFPISLAHQYPQNILRALKALANGEKTYKTYALPPLGGFPVDFSADEVIDKVLPRNLLRIKKMPGSMEPLTVLKQMFNQPNGVYADYFDFVIDACYYDKPEKRRKLYQLHSDLSQFLWQDAPKYRAQENNLFFRVEEGMEETTFAVEFPTFAMQQTFLNKVGGEGKIKNSIFGESVNFPKKCIKPNLKHHCRLDRVGRAITFSAHLRQDDMLEIPFPSVEVRDAFCEVLGLSELEGCAFSSTAPVLLMDCAQVGFIHIYHPSLRIRESTSLPSPKILRDLTPEEDDLQANYGLLLNQFGEQGAFLAEAREAGQEVSQHLLNKSEYRQPFSVIMSYLADGNEKCQERQEIAYDWTGRIREGKIQKIDEVVRSVGGFSGYRGMHGQKINNPDKEGSGFLVKQVLKGLNPVSGWETSSLTRLQQPLQSQKEGQIAISTEDNFYAKEAFGEGGCFIDRENLAKLSNSSRICTLSDLIPKALFLKIQNELWPYPKKQETRTLGEILGELGKYERFRDECCAMGLFSPEGFDKIAQHPMLILASGVCHSQEIHFLVEQRLGEDGKAYNHIRNGDLNFAVPTVLLSIPGLNLRYGVGISQEYQKTLIQGMWDCVLSSAKERGVSCLSIPAIGLGAFAGPEPHKTAEYYFEELMSLLSTKYRGDFTHIYYNPTSNRGDFSAQFEAAKIKYAGQLGECAVENFKGDVKFLAVELAKKGITCGLVNPSDADVIWGVYDVGEYYKSDAYALEEDIAATSTAPLGSRCISDVYQNPNKISSTTLQAQVLSKRSQQEAPEEAALPQKRFKCVK